MIRTYLTALILAAVATAAGAAAQRPAPRAQRPAPVEFNRDIRPILSDKCFACHGPDANHRKAGLRLDLAGGTALSGRRAMVPGKPELSELVRRIIATNALRMPPASTGKKLSAAEIELLKRWVAQGAAYEPHWAYVPPKPRPLPAVKNASWVRNPIDRFVLAKIEAAGLAPSPEADRITLIRRLSLDLTGIPPTPQEVSQFLSESEAEARLPKAQSPTPDAYDRLVDRLLASPRYGERMAMYWLDLVRYADTVGYHGDQEQHITPYRDWVIKAFNDNLPFDRFTLEQLAGDLLVKEMQGNAEMGGNEKIPRPPGSPISPFPHFPISSSNPVSSLIASGYNRLLQTTHEGGAQDREYRAKYAADRVRNFSGAWLGATMGCAECHDHKYDPFTQKDFYSLSAFFADVQEKGAFGGPDQSPTLRPPEMDVLSPFDQEEADRISARIAELMSGAEAEKRGQEIAGLQQRYDELRKRKRPTLITVSVEPRQTRVLRRGDWMDDGGEIVQAATPRFLPAPRVADRRANRLDLARWVTSPANPLTARVFANRVWSLLFGAGLSRSLEDCGAQGEPPTHPELLDWLAVAFREGVGPQALGIGGGSPDAQGPTPNARAWNVKALVRLIVTSAAYRQSSDLRPGDPENRLLARQARFRVPAEMIRDSALAASGLLVEKLGGPSARPYQPEGYYDLLNFPKRTYKHDGDDGQWRRGLYVHWQRQFLHPMLRAFDAPSREECTAKRPLTNTPLQALTLLNDPSFIEAARALGARTLREGGADTRSRIRWAWRVVLSREPHDREIAALEKLFERNRSRYAADSEAAKKLIRTGLAPVPADLDPSELAAWTMVGRALFNLNEAITRS